MLIQQKNIIFLVYDFKDDASKVIAEMDYIIKFVQKQESKFKIRKITTGNDEIAAMVMPSNVKFNNLKALQLLELTKFNPTAKIISVKGN